MSMRMRNIHASKVRDAYSIVYPMMFGVDPWEMVIRGLSRICLGYVEIIKAPLSNPPAGLHPHLRGFQGCLSRGSSKYHSCQLQRSFNASCSAWRGCGASSSLDDASGWKVHEGRLEHSVAIYVYAVFLTFTGRESTHTWDCFESCLHKGYLMYTTTDAPLDGDMNDNYLYFILQRDLCCPISIENFSFAMYSKLQNLDVVGDVAFAKVRCFCALARQAAPAWICNLVYGCCYQRICAIHAMENQEKKSLQK